MNFNSRPIESAYKVSARKSQELILGAEGIIDEVIQLGERQVEGL